MTSLLEQTETKETEKVPGVPVLMITRGAVAGNSDLVTKVQYTQIKEKKKREKAK
jgi:hypothetical protein